MAKETGERGQVGSGTGRAGKDSEDKDDGKQGNCFQSLAVSTWQLKVIYNHIHVYGDVV